MTALADAPSWLVLICSALVCGLLAIGFRLLLQRHLADDRAAALTVAGPLMPALGAVFALLAATTLGAEAGQFRSAGDDVSAEAAAASRLAWASTTPGIDSEAIQAGPHGLPRVDAGHGVGFRPRRVARGDGRARRPGADGPVGGRRRGAGECPGR